MKQSENTYNSKQFFVKTTGQNVYVNKLHRGCMNINWILKGAGSNKNVKVLIFQGT